MIFVCKEEEERKKYLQYIDEKYGLEGLTQILQKVADMIGAKFSMWHSSYEPQGASVTILIAEEQIQNERQDVVAHMDKSHNYGAYLSTKCIHKMGFENF